MALLLALWFWQKVLNFNPISIKFQRDSNILAFLEAGLGTDIAKKLSLTLFFCLWDNRATA